MIQPRNIGIAIILSIITCGLYYLYWIFAMTREIAHLNNAPTFSGGLTIILGIVTCGIYFLFWFYQVGEHLTQLKAKHNMPASNDSLLLVILAVFSLDRKSTRLNSSHVAISYAVF